MLVVVTGSAGFIGRHVVAALADAGHLPVGLDRRPAPHTRHCELTALTPRHPVADIVAEADAVVHLAASAGVRRRAVGGTDPWEQDNVVATRRLLAVVPFSTPLVVASSSSVYGGAALTPGGVRPSVESDPLRPLGGYARSKVVVEALCAARRREGAPVAVVRPFTVVGEGQRPDMALHRWIEAARAGRPLRVLGSGRRGRDLTRVEDVVEGLLRVLQRGFVGTVNLGSGSLVTLDEMVETVREEVARVPVVVEPAHPAEAVFTLADTRRCQRQLGFRPATDLAAVVRAMVGERAPLAFKP